MARQYTKKPKPIEKKDPFYIYKILTKYLLTPSSDIKKEKLLDEICKNPAELKKAKNKTLLYLEAFPEIIYKINKYINIYNNIINSATDKDILQFYSFLLEPLHLKFNTFYKSKYNVHEYSEFSKVIKKYYDQLDEFPSSEEIQALFILYKENILPPEILNDLMVEGEVENKSKTKQAIKTPFSKPEDVLINSDNYTFDDLNNSVKELINNFHKNATTSVCKSCEYFRNHKIVLDCNIELTNTNTVDILFVGYHPFNSDYKRKLPLSGKESSFLREVITNLLNKYNQFKYGIINIISCVIDDNLVPNINSKAIIRCNCLYNIFKTSLRPKIILLLGDKVWKPLGVKGTISKINGTTLKDHDGYTLIPTADITEPCSVRNKNYFAKALETALNIIETDQIKTNITIENSQQSNYGKYNIPSDKIITSLNDNYTLIDIKELNNKLLYILKDENNIKRYYFDNSKIPIYIKQGNYLQCNMITNKVDYIAYLDHFELFQLNKKLYQDMQNLTK